MRGGCHRKQKKKMKLNARTIRVIVSSPYYTKRMSEKNPVMNVVKLACHIVTDNNQIYRLF